MSLSVLGRKSRRPDRLVIITFYCPFCEEYTLTYCISRPSSSPTGSNTYSIAQDAGDRIILSTSEVRMKAQSSTQFLRLFFFDIERRVPTILIPRPRETTRMWRYFSPLTLTCFVVVSIEKIALASHAVFSGAAIERESSVRSRASIENHPR
jgi:hypothetical protein